MKDMENTSKVVTKQMILDAIARGFVAGGVDDWESPEFEQARELTRLGGVVLADASATLDRYDTIHACQNCTKEWVGSDLKDIQDYDERVEDGEPEPTGECPECGALCHPVQAEASNTPRKTA